MKLSKKLEENLLNLAEGNKIHLNYYTGSGRYQKKSADWCEKLYYELKYYGFVQKEDFIFSNDAPRGGYCGDYIKIKNIEKFKKVFEKQIKEAEEIKKYKEEKKKLEEEQKNKEKIEKAKTFLPLFQENKEKIKEIKEKEGLSYKSLYSLFEKKEIYNFFILYKNKIFVL